MCALQEPRLLCSDRRDEVYVQLIVHARRIYVVRNGWKAEPGLEVQFSKNSVISGLFQSSNRIRTRMLAMDLPAVMVSFARRTNASLSLRIRRRQPLSPSTPLSTTSESSSSSSSSSNTIFSMSFTTLTLPSTKLCTVPAVGSSRKRRLLLLLSGPCSLRLNSILPLSLVNVEA